MQEFRSQTEDGSPHTHFPHIVSRVCELARSLARSLGRKDVSSVLPVRVSANMSEKSAMNPQMLPPPKTMKHCHGHPDRRHRAAADADVG